MSLPDDHQHNPQSTQPASTRRSRAKRIIWRLARSAVIIYLVLAVVLFAFQDYMIFPGRSTQGARHAQIRESPNGNYELIHLTTARGDKTAALFGAALDADGRPRTDAASQPTILFFYGNAMCLADCFGIMDDFRRLGANVMVAEYVGYGMSTGQASEQAFYETADACWEQLQSRRDVDPRKIIAAGWSLGAGVAVDLASRKPVVGLATFSAFTSVKQMARNIVPWLPTSLLLRHRFDNLAKIEQIKVPILIVHGQHDRLIPFSMSDMLFNAATSSPRVKKVNVMSDHNDLFDTQEAVLEPLKAFIDSLR